MEVVIKILAKHISASPDGDNLHYSLTLQLTIDEEPVVFQGQAFAPTVITDEATWNSVYPGSELVGEIL